MSSGVASTRSDRVGQSLLRPMSGSGWRVCKRMGFVGNPSWRVNWLDPGWAQAFGSSLTYRGLVAVGFQKSSPSFRKSMCRWSASCLGRLIEHEPSRSQESIESGNRHGVCSAIGTKPCFQRHTVHASLAGRADK